MEVPADIGYLSGVSLAVFSKILHLSLDDYGSVPPCSLTRPKIYSSSTSAFALLLLSVSWLTPVARAKVDRLATEIFTLLYYCFFVEQFLSYFLENLVDTLVALGATLVEDGQALLRGILLRVLHGDLLILIHVALVACER